MNFPVLRYGVYDIAVQSEMAFIIPDWTLPYISFEILFCQKKVKKNRKLVPRVFFKDADIMREEAYGMYASFRWLVYTGGDNMNLLLRYQTIFNVHTIPHYQEVFLHSVEINE